LVSVTHVVVSIQLPHPLFLISHNPFDLWSQFRQRFTHTFLYESLFGSLSLLGVWLWTNVHTKNVHAKCWWNWHLLGFGPSASFCVHKWHTHASKVRKTESWHLLMVSCNCYVIYKPNIWIYMNITIHSFKSNQRLRVKKNIIFDFTKVVTPQGCGRK